MTLPRRTPVPAGLDDLQGLVTGVFVASLGLFLLKASHTLTGGLAGLALLLGYAAPGVPFVAFYVGATVPFLLVASWRRGLVFGLRTGVAVALVAALAVLHPLMIGAVAVDSVYGALTGNLLVGLGMLILFRHRASLGGINTAALLLEERFGWRVAYVQGVFDLAVVSASLLVATPAQVAVSAAGVVLLNAVLALNHRPLAPSRQRSSTPVPSEVQAATQPGALSSSTAQRTSGAPARRPSPVISETPSISARATYDAS